MTGTTWLEESGFLDGPVMITNTHSVGVVRDSYIQWQVKNAHRPSTNVFGDSFFSLPIVAETFDGSLNDVNGFHVKPEHVVHALESAASGSVAEGNVGGGTGMVCYGFKGGSGTASRALDGFLEGYTVGVFVQCNCGRRQQLRIAGVPVGLEIPTDVAALTGPKWMGARTSVHHHRGGHRCALCCCIIETPGRGRISMGLARNRIDFREQLGRHSIVFSTATRTGEPLGDAGGSLKMVPTTRRPAVRSHCPGHRGSHCERHGLVRETMTGVNGDKEGAAASRVTRGAEEIYTGWVARALGSGVTGSARGCEARKREISSGGTVSVGKPAFFQPASRPG